jgi:hypothetical protein
MATTIRKEQPVTHGSTLNRKRSQPTETNVPVYGQTIASKALQQCANDEKVKRPVATRNQRLKNTTVTAPENDDAQAYADMASNQYSNRTPPAEFETTLDGNAIRPSCGGIPTWDKMAVDYHDPRAPTTIPVDVFDNEVVGTGYHKAPKTMVYSLDDNNRISMQHVPGFEGSRESLAFSGYKAGGSMSESVFRQLNV